MRLPRPRVPGVGAEQRQRSLHLRGGLRVALAQLGLEVGEGRGRALLEGDRLLDLERDGHAVVVDAVAVFLGDQIEEAHELSGAAGLLLGGEGGGHETVDHGQGLLPGLGEGARGAAGARAERGEGGVRLGAVGRAALGLVLGARISHSPEAVAAVSARRASKPRSAARPASSSSVARRAW